MTQLTVETEGLRGALVNFDVPPNRPLPQGAHPAINGLYFRVHTVIGGSIQKGAHPAINASTPRQTVHMTACLP